MNPACCLCWWLRNVIADNFCTSAARAYLADDLPMPRHARHLYLVAVDGRIVERVGHNTAAQNQHRSRADRMPTGTLAILRTPWAI